MKFDALVAMKAENTQARERVERGVPGVKFAQKGRLWENLLRKLVIVA